MRKWVRVKGRLESITIFDPTATMGDANETKQMTLKDYMYPTRSTQPPVSPCQPLRQILRLNPG